jgi:hypothetical protein
MKYIAGHIYKVNKYIHICIFIDINACIYIHKYMDEQNAYTYENIYIYLYIYIYKYIHIGLWTFVYICMQVCKYIKNISGYARSEYISIYIYTYTYIYVFTYMHVCMYMQFIRIDMCTYMYTYL